MSRGLWVGLSVACSWSCVFPSYLIEKERELPAAGASGESATGGATGGTTGGVAGTASATGGEGASPDEAGAAGAGQAGSSGLVFDPKPWSTSALDELGFALIGSAKLDANGVALTQLNMKSQAGALIERDRLQLEASTTLHVSLRFSIQSGSPSGDGLALVFHNDPAGYMKLGSAGGGMGYAGLSPCVAIEIDTAGTTDTDNPAPHLALIPECLPQEHGIRTASLGGDPRDGQPWRLTVDWDAVADSLQIRLLNESNQQEAMLSEHFDLATSVGPSPFVAVTSASGEFTATHLVSELELAGGGLGPRALSATP